MRAVRRAAGPPAAPRRADSVTACTRSGRLRETTAGETPASETAAGDSSVTVQTVAVRLGETPVEIRITERPCRRTCWSAINVHDDENTAVEAALAVLARHGGRLVELRHAGTRNLAFRVGGEAFTVDPNRIFTDAGRARTLASLARDTPAARAAVAAFADTLLAVYGTPAVVVALHNNTEANYSAASYQPGGSDASEAAAVSLLAGADPDDFVFVTTRPLFDAVVADGVRPSCRTTTRRPTTARSPSGPRRTAARTSTSRRNTATATRTRA